MKEIKAYVKLSVLDSVVAGLKEAGCPCMTIVDVSGLGEVWSGPWWIRSCRITPVASGIPPSTFVVQQG
ncbi:MAG: hypothetical protein OEM41_07365 [Ignavibacteria bacterium]|nr:hypothetical protein [Ignavibacteria bacterium]